MLARDKACWQGEPVVAVLAESRAQAEDAAEAVAIEWEELASVADPALALSPEAPVIHAELGDNLAIETRLEAGDAAAAFVRADLIVSESFRFGRHAGVSLEPRSIVADYNPAEASLTVHQSLQTPHQHQDLYARLFEIPEHRVRVMAPDVGGAFGLKHHIYGDEVAACALSILTGRPVKFIADRLESFLTDVHCRDHRVEARLALSKEGEILAFEVDDLFAIGAYSQYPRSSIAEGNQFIRLAGAPYRHQDYAARLRMVYQNKNQIGHIRAVGYPIACAVTEHLVDLGAAELDLEPMELRRRNFLTDADCPLTSPGGIRFENVSLDACFERIVQMLDLAALRQEQARLREAGVDRGIGFASVVDLSAVGPEYYGGGGLNISSQEVSVRRPGD